MAHFRIGEIYRPHILAGISVLRSQSISDTGFIGETTDSGPIFLNQTNVTGKDFEIFEHFQRHVPRSDIRVNISLYKNKYRFFNLSTNIK